jgi:hypothetical protein
VGGDQISEENVKFNWNTIHARRFKLLETSNAVFCFLRKELVLITNLQFYNDPLFLLENPIEKSHQEEAYL